jgi:peptidoglycan/xylan/chitin deacetylase (PgdA/CDA1 family)
MLPKAPNPFSPPPRTFVLLFAFFLVFPAHAAREVALTIDDLPFVWASRFPQKEKTEMFRAVLAAARKEKVPMMAFVIGGHIGQGDKALLSELKTEGHSLANHSYSHPDHNKTKSAAYLKDIEQGARALKEWPGAERFFRFPMLHHGETAAKKAAAQKLLKARGWLNVPVSIDTDDWAYSRDYVEALQAGDSAKAQEIGEAYLAHMKERALHYEKVAEQKLKRPIKHILLTHMNALNAKYFPRLLAWYKSEGWTFIRTEEALKDPVYSLPDPYVGKNGISWLDRIAAQ